MSYDILIVDDISNNILFLKKIFATQGYHIRLIFLSGCDRADDKIKAFNLGGIDYITKPFFPEEVLIRTKNQLTIQEQKKQLISQNPLC